MSARTGRGRSTGAGTHPSVDPNSSLFKRQLKAAYRDLILQLDPTLLVTHNFHYQTETQDAHRKMKDFYNRIQRKAFGTRWNKTAHPGAPNVVAFGEHPHSNHHWHAVVASGGRVASVIMDRGPVLWKELSYNGQLDVRPVTDLQGLADYVTKNCGVPPEWTTYSSIRGSHRDPVNTNSVSHDPCSDSRAGRATGTLC